MDANESFERAAEAFYKATGHLMPGKDVAAAAYAGEEQEAERQAHFKTWCAAIEYMKKARAEQLVLIWSHEHSGWWMPNSRGYCTSVHSAGRYTLEEAVKICWSANSYGRPGGTPNEIISPAPENVAGYELTGIPVEARR